MLNLPFDLLKASRLTKLDSDSGWHHAAHGGHWSLPMVHASVIRPVEADTSTGTAAHHRPQSGEPRASKLLGFFLQLHEHRVGIGGSSSRSEYTPVRGMPCACPLASRTACEADGTGSAKRRCVPRPSAIVLTRCYVPYCASRAEARRDVRAEHDGYPPRRRPGPRACKDTL